MKSYLGAILLLAAALMMGCSRKTTDLDTRASVTKSISLKSLDKMWDAEQPDYAYAHGSTRLGVAFDGQRYRATGQFIHHRGEVIYMTVKKIGFQLGEVWITPDSFHMTNRLLNEYISEPLSTLEAEYNITADFELLEELMTGLPSIDRGSRKKKTNYRDGLHLVETERRSGIGVLLRFLPTIELQDARYSDATDRRIALTYKDWDRDLVSRRIQTSNIDDGELTADLAYQRVTFERRDVPTFVVPRGYERTTF